MLLVVALLLPLITKAQKATDKSTILNQLRLANGYFMNKWKDPTAEIIGNKVRPSNIWTRAVYYEGLMKLYRIDPDPKYIQYAVEWGGIS